MRTVVTRTGAVLPVLGLGTWKMGSGRSPRGEEVAALRLGLDLGVTLIDTAELYDDAELVVAEAIEGRREGLFLVSKVLPSNASRKGTIEAAERSLRRLRTDRLDLYLLHWPGSFPLEETLEAFTRLREQGKILHYGLSNFDTAEMEEAGRIAGGEGIAVNQVLYNLNRRGIERRLLPWCTGRGIPIMAYSPLDQGDLAPSPAMESVARRHGVDPMQVAIAWTARLDGVVTIAKAVRPDHVRSDVAAAGLRLSAEDLEALDRAHPAPESDIPLETA